MKIIFVKINFVTHHELYRIRKTPVPAIVSKYSEARQPSIMLPYLYQEKTPAT